MVSPLVPRIPQARSSDIRWYEVDIKKNRLKPIQMKYNTAGLHTWKRSIIGFASLCLRMSSWRWRCRRVSQGGSPSQERKNISQQTLRACVRIAFNMLSTLQNVGLHPGDIWKLLSLIIQTSLPWCTLEIVFEERYPKSLFKLLVESYVHYIASLSVIESDSFHMSFMITNTFLDRLEYSSTQLFASSRLLVGFGKKQLGVLRFR